MHCLFLFVVVLCRAGLTALLFVRADEHEHDCTPSLESNRASCKRNVVKANGAAVALRKRRKKGQQPRSKQRTKDRHVGVGGGGVAKSSSFKPRPTKPGDAGRVSPVRPAECACFCSVAIIFALFLFYRITVMSLVSTCRSRRFRNVKKKR